MRLETELSLPAMLPTSRSFSSWLIKRNRLRYFCAMADVGGFNRAAECVHSSQPSLSEQIRKLEDEVGARRFDRLGRGIRVP